MAKRSKPQTIEYAFRFAKGTDAERTRMAEMVRVNLQELVKQVILTHHGQPVSVDGFQLRDVPETTYKLAQPVSHAHVSPPGGEEKRATAKHKRQRDPG